MESVHLALVRLILNYNNSKVNQNQFNKIHIHLRYDNNAIWKPISCLICQ